MTIAEYFERILEQDHKQKSANLLALQLQGQRPKQHLGFQHCTFLGVHYQTSGPKIGVSTVINCGIGKEIVLNGPMQILLKALRLAFKGELLTQLKDSQGFSAKLLLGIPLNRDIQGIGIK